MFDPSPARCFQARRILLYGLNFHPEPTGIGKYTGEMAQWLARAGHEVRVITTPPYYPEWKIGQGFRGWHYRRKHWEGVEVFRAPLWVPRRLTGLKRLVHLASFAVSSFPVLLQSLVWRPHLVLCVAPAMACAPAASLIARLSGARSWLHVQDFEVDMAFEMNMLRGDAARSLVLRLESWLLRSFDRVSSISHRMVDTLRAKGVAAQRALLFPNWVDTDTISPASSDNAFRRELGIPKEAFVVLYSGTMGAKQGLDTVAEAVNRLADEPHIHFVFCGRGAGREGLEAACAGRPRVHWLDLQPMEKLSELLATADVHLLPQQRAAADLVLPSKLTGMLASGRPVLATAAPDTELATWVQGCGLVVPPGDAEAIAQGLLQLSRDPARCAALGQEARQRAVERLSRDAVLEQFCAGMEGAISRRASPIELAPFVKTEAS